MARYDRIAPLPSPTREGTFPGWLVLRDLEGRERDAELSRRARLRFLALRPLLRILRLGVEGVSAASYAREMESIREELGHLPSRDTERARLSRFLHEIEQRSPADLPGAACGLGELAEEAGHPSAAEEFYRTGAELAHAFELPAAAAAALRRLGELCRHVGRDEDGRQHLAAAAAAASAAGARGEWARATCAGALLALAEGEAGPARATLLDVLQHGQVWGEPEVLSVAACALAEQELAAGDAEAALEHAWSALESAPDAPARMAALERAGAALRALDLHEGAARCYDLLLRDDPPAAVAWRVEADLAAALAEGGQPEQFLAARARLLRELRLPLQPRTAAELHLRLGRACLLVGAGDFARDHLRDGLDAARRGGQLDLVAGFERLLPFLERASARELLVQHRSAGERARHIAGAIEARLAGAPSA